MNSFVLIDTDQQIDDVVEAIIGEQVVGVDAERASGFRYGQSAYLVQLIAEQQAYLIDPVAISSTAIEKLAAEINKKEWILHSATQDLPCLSELGMKPTRIFDTEIAAKLCGFEKFGLAALVLEISQVELKKEHSAADWSTRPLSPEMLEYAAQDVYYLKNLRESLIKQLTDLGRLDFAQQEFNHLLDFRPKEIGPNPWRRTSGIHALTKPLQLARLREMWVVRDRYSSEHDIAPGRVVSDRALSHAAAQNYKSLTEMKKDKQFHGRLLPKLYPQLFEAFKQAADTEMPVIRESAPEAIPHHKNWQKLKPEVDKKYKEIRVGLNEIAGELGIPVENIISPSTIREALWKEVPASEIEQFLANSGARQWQLGLVLPLLRDLT